MCRSRDSPRIFKNTSHHRKRSKTKQSANEAGPTIMTTVEMAAYQLPDVGPVSAQGQLTVIIMRLMNVSSYLIYGQGDIEVVEEVNYGTIRS